MATRGYRGNSLHKGSEERETHVAGREWVSGRVLGDEIREAMGQIDGTVGEGREGRVEQPSCPCPSALQSDTPVLCECPVEALVVHCGPGTCVHPGRHP